MEKILENTVKIIFSICIIISILPANAGEIKEYRFNVVGISKTYGAEGINNIKKIHQEAFLSMLCEGLFLLPVVVNKKAALSGISGYNRLHYKIGKLDVNIRGSENRYITEIIDKKYSILYNNSEVLFPSIIDDVKIFNNIDFSSLEEPKTLFNQKAVEPATGQEQIIFSIGITDGKCKWSDNIRFENINSTCNGLTISKNGAYEYASISCESSGTVVFSVDPEKIENEMSNANKKVLSYRFLKNNDGRRLFSSKEIQLSETIDSADTAKIESVKNNLLLTAIKNMNEQTNGVFIESFTKVTNSAVDHQEIQSKVLGFSVVKEKIFEVNNNNGSTEIKLRAVIEAPLLEYSDE